MAGDWIKMQINLGDKPEVIAIAARLNLDVDAVVGKLLRVWGWFDQHTIDGNAVGVTYSFLDRVTNVTGFAEQLALVGWLEENGATLSVPKFDRHNGKTAKNRALTNERVAKTRTKSNADVTQNVTQAPLQKPLPEKRREDIKEAPLAQPKGSRLPKDWVLPAEWETWCRAERPDLEPSVIALTFRDFWVAKAGKDAAKLDWEATWRNWVRNSRPSVVKPVLAAVNSPFAGAR